MPPFQPELCATACGPKWLALIRGFTVSTVMAIAKCASQRLAVSSNQLVAAIYPATCCAMRQASICLIVGLPLVAHAKTTIMCNKQE